MPIKKKIKKVKKVKKVRKILDKKIKISKDKKNEV